MFIFGALAIGISTPAQADECLGCCHNPCVAGEALEDACDGAFGPVWTVCQNDPYCCAADGEWDCLCVDALAELTPVECVNECEDPNSSGTGGDTGSSGTPCMSFEDCPIGVACVDGECLPSDGGNSTSGGETGYDTDGEDDGDTRPSDTSDDDDGASETTAGTGTSGAAGGSSDTGHHGSGGDDQADTGEDDKYDQADEPGNEGSTVRITGGCNVGGRGEAPVGLMALLGLLGLSARRRRD